MGSARRVTATLLGTMSAAAGVLFAATPAAAASPACTNFTSDGLDWRSARA